MWWQDEERETKEEVAKVGGSVTYLLLSQFIGADRLRQWNKSQSCSKEWMSKQQLDKLDGGAVQCEWTGRGQINSSWTLIARLIFISWSRRTRLAVGSLGELAFVVAVVFTAAALAARYLSLSESIHYNTVCWRPLKPSSDGEGVQKTKRKWWRWWSLNEQLALL